MKTDLLSRIVNSEDYFQELIYQLYGDYPDSKIVTWTTWGGDRVIFTDNESLLKSVDIISNWYKKFPYELISIHSFENTPASMYNIYLMEKEYELV